MYFIPTFHCNGHCEEVIDLYQKAFDLKIDWQGKNEETGLIYHTEAHIGEQRIRLSDGNMEHVAITGDSLFLAVMFDTTEEVNRAFNVLNEGGTVIQLPHKSEFATYICELKDKFGFKWFLMVD